ncbi:MAG: protein-ADP-ribose hydrolase [Methanosphaera sp.]|nr:protein-ADP-ribose hydrolase [Methanosphaera sp.]
MDTIDYLIDYLLKENPKIRVTHNPENDEEKFRLYRSLCNIRQPNPINEKYLEKEDELLSKITENKNLTDYRNIQVLEDMIPENNVNNDDIIAIWKGDITSIKVGAIVNAANSQGLGCFSPCHNCIDNQIHTYAGVSLRLECNKIMKDRDYNLPTGEAFITKAYNLPADYVIHTVGPILRDKVYDEQIQQLSDCYTNSLRLAQENNIRSISIPCISTGVFRFPADLASQVALKAVDDYLDTNNDAFDKVIFNLYNDKDVNVYERTIRAY